MSAEARAVAGVSGLSSSEVRVLGCLLEKQRTTPDVYPLSLNALRLAANQATNRDPVVDYDEARNPRRASSPREARPGAARQWRRQPREQVPASAGRGAADGLR